MGTRGPKPRDDDSVKVYTISVRVPAAMRHELVKQINRRRTDDPSLPLNWGLSEYIRELLASHISSLADSKPPPEPEATEAKPRRASTKRHPKQPF